MGKIEIILARAVIPGYIFRTNIIYYYYIVAGRRTRNYNSRRKSIRNNIVIVNIITTDNVCWDLTSCNETTALSSGTP